jgi:hypothetical protein
MHILTIRRSLDSTRPFMAPSTRASRYSTYSMAAPSVTSQGTSDSTVAEISEITTGLQRMENKALMQQRVVLSDAKIERMGKLALGAKLERALDRRMTSQDAVMRPRRKTTSAIPSTTSPVVSEEKPSTADDSDSKTVESVDGAKMPVTETKE